MASTKTKKPSASKTKVVKKESEFVELDDLSLSVTEDTEVVCAFKLGRDLGVVSVNSFSGKKALDLRRFCLNEEHEMHMPTAKGIRIPVHLAPELITRLYAVLETVQAHADAEQE